MTDNIDGRVLALTGLRQAAQDAESRHGLRHVSAGTGAFWACVLDEQLRDSIGAAYGATRDADEFGPTVVGLHLARNGITHGAHVMTRDRGLTFPLKAPLVIPPPSWVRLDAMLASWTPRPSRVLDEQKRLYTERVAGRRPHEPLRDVLGFFERLEASGWSPDLYASQLQG